MMIIIIETDQLSKTCGFPFKTTFNRFESSLLVCPYLHTIRLPLFSRSRGITHYQTGGNSSFLWTQQAFTH
ncbi:MAG TPA: hypothetical protein VIW25_01345, partial [Nitrososphaeraceae archaeon]